MKRVSYRRKREGKTDYNKRLKLLKSGKPRLVIRKTNKQILMQIIKFSEEGDRIIKSITSKELRKYGWQLSLKNIPAAYLTGYLLAKKSKINEELIVDIGLQEKGNRLFAAVKGAVDAGLKIRHNPEIFPKQNLIKGEHIQNYLKSSKDPIQFSQYKKSNVNVLEQIEKVKNAIDTDVR
ncbi:MAG: 50S ribosomal protein L18 [Candidatus Woesearchaeota archaeon]